MKEIWKTITDFEGVYSISNKGRLRRECGIFNRKYPHIVKLQKDKNGYASYRLSKFNIGRTVKIHRLVAEAFLGFSELTVNHKNGKKSDNRITNLEWLSMSDNRTHAKINGLMARGERSANTKLKDADIITMRKEYATGQITHQALANRFGIGRKAVTKIINRQRWTHI